MGDKTGISWTDATWNPVRGCSRISEGCRNCYAERVAARFCKPGQPYHGFAQIVAPRDLLDRVGGRRNGWTRKIDLVPEHLADPLRWKKPRRIFVNSMSDLFHESLTNEQIAAVFGVMAAAPQHTFQILTKRAQRMREWFDWVADQGAIDVCPREAWQHLADPEGPSAIDAALERASRNGRPTTWPLPNVWLGVSVENQAAADERIPDLLATPAAVRFLSCEPLLGPVDLEHVRHHLGGESYETGSCLEGNDGFGLSAPRERIDWVIAGCESGPGARPCEVQWLRSLRDQCKEAGVAFWLKQAVETLGEHVTARAGGTSKRKPGGIIELPYLDGVQHAEMPGGAL